MLSAEGETLYVLGPVATGGLSAYEVTSGRLTAAYSEGRPEQFDEIVAPDYVDYGHTPPGHGPQGARDDYENAVKFAGGVLVYDIDALVARGFDRATILRVWRMLDRAEYKRRQAPPGVKITPRAFGRDRRYPITNGFTSLVA